MKIKDPKKLDNDLRMFVEICENLEPPEYGKNELFDALTDSASIVYWVTDPNELAKFLYNIRIEHLAHIVSIIANGKFNYKKNSLELFLKEPFDPASQGTDFLVDKIISEKDRLRHFKAAFKPGTFGS